MVSGCRNRIGNYELQIRQDSYIFFIHLVAGNGRTMMKSEPYETFDLALKSARRIGNGLGMAVYFEGRDIQWIT